MMTEARARLVKTSPTPLELVGRSTAIARVHELVRRAALTDGGVLLVADRGADVTSVAEELHARTRRAAAPFVQVDCASSDPTRLDEWLFGAAPSASGDLEVVSRDSQIAANFGGTIFLRDVAELPASVQTRLARIARDGEVRIDGQSVPTNLRWVASASPGLEGDVQTNRFRADLYRRLAKSRIDLPPLRDRADDVPALASCVLDNWCAARECSPRTMTQAALALLGALMWSGNLAELRAVVERAAEETPRELIQIEDVLPALNLERAPARFVPSGQLREARLRFERDYISAVLQHHDWRMAEAAATLGIQRPNLYRKARQLGIPLARASE
jgi:DNA-binding NtrC family response regulator